MKCLAPYTVPLGPMPTPKRRNPGASRTGRKAQSEDIVAIIKQLGDEDKLPRCNVQRDDLPLVLPIWNTSLF